MSGKEKITRRTARKNYKRELSKDDNARVFYALSHPVRWIIVQLLSREDRVPVRDLQTCLGLTYNVLYPHLAVLRECGIVASHPGRHCAYYGLTCDVLIDVRSAIDVVIAETISAQTNITVPTNLDQYREDDSMKEEQ